MAIGMSAVQLVLPFHPQAPLPALVSLERVGATAWDPALVQSLRERISRRLGGPVCLEVHDNRSTMISYRRAPGHLELRVHHMFLTSNEAVAQALADFAAAGKPRRQAGRLLDAFIRGHRHRIRPPRPDGAMQPRGLVHDLGSIYRSLNERFFGDVIDAQIGWGRMPPRRQRRSIKLGVYYHEARTIRIHPALDRAEVPGFVVEFIVYHEMLHQACPTEDSPSGRKRIHTRAFRARERSHPDHLRALAWEKENLAILLARRGSRVLPLRE